MIEQENSSTHCFANYLGSFLGSWFMVSKQTLTVLFFLFCALLKETLISRCSTTEQEYSIVLVYPLLKSSLVSGFRMFEQKYIVFFLLCYQEIPWFPHSGMFEQEYSTASTLLKDSYFQIQHI